VQRLQVFDYITQCKIAEGMPAIFRTA